MKGIDLRAIILLPILLTNCYTLQIARSISDPRPDSVRIAEAKSAKFAATRQTLRFAPDLCVSSHETQVFECKYEKSFSQDLRIAFNPVILPDFGVIVSDPALSACAGSYKIVNARTTLEKEGMPTDFFIDKDQRPDSFCALQFAVASGRRFGLFRNFSGEIESRDLTGTRPPPLRLGAPEVYRDIHIVRGNSTTVVAFDRAENSKNNPLPERYTLYYEITDRPVPASRRVLYYGVGIPTAIVIQALAPVAMVFVGIYYVIHGAADEASDLGEKGCSTCASPLKGRCIPYP